MVLLGTILPSIKELIDIGTDSIDLIAADCPENLNWQLIYLLSTLLVAILSLDGKILLNSQAMLLILLFRC